MSEKQTRRSRREVLREKDVALYERLALRMGHDHSCAYMKTSLPPTRVCDCGRAGDLILLGERLGL